MAARSGDPGATPELLRRRPVGGAASTTHITENEVDRYNPYGAVDVAHGNRDSIVADQRDALAGWRLVSTNLVIRLGNRQSNKIFELVSTRIGRRLADLLQPILKLSQSLLSFVLVHDPARRPRIQ